MTKTISTALTLMAATGLLVACAPDDDAVTSAPAPQPAASTTASATVSTTAGTVTGALAKTNGFRAQAGVAALRQNATLAQVAAAHAADLARTGSFSHTGSDGSSVGDRARRAGYRYCFIAENIAQGQDSVDEVINGWMFSPGHRANMLNGEAREMAVVRQGDLWVMVLGRDGC